MGFVDGGAAEELELELRHAVLARLALGLEPLLVRLLPGLDLARVELVGNAVNATSCSLPVSTSPR